MHAYRYVCGTVLTILLMLLLPAGRLSASEPDGGAIYREHCQSCHGEGGTGTDLPPLVGDRSVSQLTRYIDDTMPEEDPEAVVGEEARAVAAFIHGAFYSPIAQDRMRPAREDLSRLTVRQHREVLADLLGSFERPTWSLTSERGLQASYYEGRNHDRRKLVFERVDPRVNFDFGLEGPDPERFEPQRFAIRWVGSIVPFETGEHEFIVRTAHSAKLTVNGGWEDPPLIDAYVKSGNDTEYRGRIFLLAGRSYPLRLEFSKANQGVNNEDREVPTNASIELAWKPPHGIEETVPEHCLLPLQSQPVYVATTPFPPDDRSIGYERGTSISKEWFDAVSQVALETSAHILGRIDRLADCKRDDPKRSEKLQQFAATLAERAFRRPLTDDLRQRVVEQPFAEAPDLDAALTRSVYLALTSPRFLFRSLPDQTVQGDAFDTASRLSFGLWDSLPDETLREATERGQLASDAEITAQAERMLRDRRSRAKLHDFLLEWLGVDQPHDLLKDPSLFPRFTPRVAASMRTSLHLQLDALLDNVTSGRPADFRSLLTDTRVYLDHPLGEFYGVDVPRTRGYRPVALDEGQRAGILTHPYLLSLRAYADDTSPIHRGVFLTRNLLGNVLKPPPEAVAPVAADLHPGLTTRERVAQQTAPVGCQSCHIIINELGFSLESFDAVGRFRREEVAGGMARPIDASGSYVPREGDSVAFDGSRELAVFLATSPDCQEAFVQDLFHALAKQPVRAWGEDMLPHLQQRFTENGYDIRHLVVDIIKVTARPASESTDRVASILGGTP
jgi:hypothetical protein